MIVVGHHGCSGVNMALRHSATGLVAHWLRPVHDAHGRYAALLDAVGAPTPASICWPS